MGFDFSRGAAAKFVRDPNQHCSLPANTKVAGCWIPQYDLIVLKPAASLSRTALCHELLHRQLYDRTNDPDYDHQREEWSRLSTTAGTPPRAEPANPSQSQ